MVLALNVLRVLMPLLELPTNAQLVLQAKPPQLDQLMILPVKIALVRLLDVPPALILVLLHAQNALLVMV